MHTFVISIPISGFCLISSRRGFAPLLRLAHSASNSFKSARNSLDVASYFCFSMSSILVECLCEEVEREL